MVRSGMLTSVYPHAVNFIRPVDSWLCERRRVVGVLEVEDRVDPALLAREMGRGTGVTGGESSSTLSCVGEEEVEEFSACRREEEDEGPISTVRTR